MTGKPSKERRAGAGGPPAVGLGDYLRRQGRRESHLVHQLPRPPLRPRRDGAGSGDVLPPATPVPRGSTSEVPPGSRLLAAAGRASGLDLGVDEPDIGLAVRAAVV